ncbi:MAG: MCE family protein [Deltaproteobacteria bacterium]|jgi:phospholipid/cholesterol/gamma-HCH transport system substrate-binding protein|nr:MCE family protein [Deltaproteobacteria bacterium]
MDRDARVSLIVGAFVLLAMSAMAAAILSLGAERGLFRSQYRLTAHFANVLGLLPGAPVWLGGKEVGRVDRIAFEPMSAERPVLVELRVNEEVQDRIRDDSVATIGTIGLLGDSYVEISFGSEGSAVLLDGDTITTADPVNVTHLMSEGRNALASIRDLSASVNNVVQTFSDKEGAERAVDAIEAVSDIMIEAREGDGLLHSLIFDPYEGGGTESLSRSLASLEEILAEIREGDGLLHSLVYTPPDQQEIVQEALAASGSLNSILGKIDEGEGTLGLLLNDPTVFEDLKVLLGGAQRSTLMRSMIRMAVEQGEESP